VNGAKNVIEESDIIFVGGVLTTMKFNLKNFPKYEGMDYAFRHNVLAWRREFEAELREIAKEPTMECCEDHPSNARVALAKEMLGE